MKLITLNIWGGHVKAPLLDFIKSYTEVDIFCLQEVYHQALEKVSKDEREVSLNIFSELNSLLPNHRAFFRPIISNIYGIGMLVKNNIKILGEGEILIHENPDYPGKGPTHSRNLQWLTCSKENKTYSIVNIHGLWNGMGKTDSAARIEQSMKIKNFLDKLRTPKIVCGDFNLRPDTESMKIIEEGMNNLIRTYNITSTRTSLYPKPEKFADYILTSTDISINHFEVLKDEVSDHSALLLDFTH